MARPIIVVQTISTPLRFALGSTSVDKYLALCSVLESTGFPHPEQRIEVVSSRSGVNSQPFEKEESMLGALNRARAARQRFPRHIVIGIENGIVKEDGQYFDVGFVVVITRDGTEFWENTDRLLLPTEAVEEARRRGFTTTTVGQVLAEQHVNWQANDPHRHLVNRPRVKFLAPAIYCALARATNRIIDDGILATLAGQPDPSNLPQA